MPVKPVFISYAHEDLAIVIRLKKALKFNGILVWIDHDNLEPGTPDWEKAIESGIPQCQALIYVATPRAKVSEHIGDELFVAKHYSIPIYPYWVAGVDWFESAPLSLVRTQYIDARAEQADYGDAFSDLLKVLKKNDPLKEPTQTKETTKPSDSSHSETQPAIAIVPVINPLVAPPTPTAPAPVETTSPPEPVPQTQPTSPMEPASQGTSPKQEDGGFKWLRPVAVVLIAALLLSGASAVFLKNRLVGPPPDPSTPTVAPTQRPPRWEIVASQNPEPQNVLYGVAAIGADNVWAAGYHRDKQSTKLQSTLIEHWDGSSWTQSASPNGGGATNVFNGLKAVTSNDIWVVGDTGSGAHYSTLIEHWDGHTWMPVDSPNPGSTVNVLYGIIALTTNNAWAVGTYKNGADATAQQLIEHWDGHTWKPVDSSHVGSGDNTLRSISAVDANHIWAVGAAGSSTLIEYCDGSSWTPVDSPNNASGDSIFYGVTALESNDVWAVGGGKSTLIVHWDGSSWKAVPSISIDPSRNILNSVSAVDANDMWTVGMYGPENTASSNYTLIEHWTNSA